MNQWGKRFHKLHPAQEMICKNCLEPFTAYALNARYCPACRELKKLERMEAEKAERAANHKMRAMQTHWNSLPYEVVSDPLPADDGGLVAGARFTKQAVDLTLEMSCFTAGTVLKRLPVLKNGRPSRKKKGTRYQKEYYIVEQVNGHQALTELGEVGEKQEETNEVSKA